MTLNYTFDKVPRQWKFSLMSQYKDNSWEGAKSVKELADGYTF